MGTHVHRWVRGAYSCLAYEERCSCGESKWFTWAEASPTRPKGLREDPAVARLLERS